MCPVCVIPWFVVVFGLGGTTLGMWLSQYPWIFYTAMAVNLVLIVWAGFKIKKFYGKHKGCNIK